MASNNVSEDFDDFFDTPKATASKHEQTGKGERNPHRRNTRSVSPDRERNRSADYSSESSTQSGSDSDDHSHRPGRRRSRSSSSRSGGSFSSDDSKSRSRRQNGKRHSRSRSSSFNTSRSRSRTDSDGSITGDDGATEIKVEVIHRRDSNSSGASKDSCAKIDLGQHDNHHARQGPRDAARNQAWSTESRSGNSYQGTTVTTKQRSSSDRESRKRSDEHRQGHRKHSPGRSDSSDITEVSPFSSPRSGGACNKLESKPPKCLARAPGVRSGSGRARRDGGEPNALELNLLMKAVSELEKQTRVQANTRRVMLECGRPQRGDQKGSYTFSDHDIHRIEQENQRLLRQIMCRMHAMDGKGPGTRDRGLQSTSAASGINRRKDHVRIEKENLALLKRLQQIRPSRGLSRQEQLSAYNSTLFHGVPIPTMHHPTTTDNASRKQSSAKSSRAGSKAGSEAGSLGRTRSLTSIQSATTTASSIRSGHSRRSVRSRPSSAKMSLRERPPWDDRW